MPKNIEQDYLAGNNNLYAARAARYTYYFRTFWADEGFTRDWVFEYHKHIQKEISKWNEESGKYLNAVAFSE